VLTQMRAQNGRSGERFRTMWTSVRALPRVHAWMFV